MTPKMRKANGMTLYVGEHCGVGYVVTREGVWWTHDGDDGAERDDEKAYEKVIQIIEERHGKKQSRTDDEAARDGAASGLGDARKGQASVGSGGSQGNDDREKQ